MLSSNLGSRRKLSGERAQLHFFTGVPQPRSVELGVPAAECDEFLVRAV